MKELLNTIRNFAAEIEKIEITHDQRQRLNTQVLNHATHFLETLPEKKAYQADYDAQRTIVETAITENSTDIAALLQVIEDHIENPGVNTASGNYFGYIPAGGLYTAALGDYLSATINRYSGLYFMAPGAVELEKSLIKWACELIGYPSSAFGNITSGASIATLIAITTARSVRNICSTDYGRLVVYLGEHTHHCFAKALNVAGLGEVVQRVIAVDKHYVMDVSQLQQMIDADTANGLIPWILVATAGTTNTGAIDPLVTLSEIAKKNAMWLHIDAAYGGFFMLTQQGKQLLKGLSQADSVVLDAHKTLFMPYGIAMILVKNHRHLLDAHQYTAHYLQDAALETEAYAAASLSPELTRPFRGLRLWLSLKLLGVKYFRMLLEEKLLLAQYFYKKIKAIDQMEAFSPNLSIVLFRYLPTQIDRNLFNHLLHQELLQDGRIFLSTTKINGHYYLRFACLSFRSHLENVDLAIAVLLEKIKKIQDDSALTCQNNLVHRHPQEVSN